MTTTVQDIEDGLRGRHIKEKHRANVKSTDVAAAPGYFIFKFPDLRCLWMWDDLCHANEDTRKIPVIGWRITGNNVEPIPLYFETAFLGIKHTNDGYSKALMLPDGRVICHEDHDMADLNAESEEEFLAKLDEYCQWATEKLIITNRQRRLTDEDPIADWERDFFSGASDEAIKRTREEARKNKFV